MRMQSQADGGEKSADETELGHGSTAFSNTQHSLTHILLYLLIE